MKARIKTKLLVGFGACLLLLIGIAVFMLLEFSKANKQLGTLVESSSKKIELSYQILRNVLETGIREKEILLQGDQQERDFSALLTVEKVEEVSVLSKELNELVDRRGQEILLQFNGSWNIYLGVVQKISELEEQEKNQAAMQLVQHAEEVRQKSIAALEKLINKNEVEIQRKRQISEDNFNEALTSIVIAVVFGVIISLLVSYWIIVSINRRISEIARKAERLASREYSEERLVQNIDDELNPIVSSLVKIDESFKEVTENANRIASGEYRLKTPPRSDRDVLGLALQEMAVSLQKSTDAREMHHWLTSGMNRLNDRLMGNQELVELTENIVSFLANYLDARVGAIYLVNEAEGVLELTGHYGLSSRAQIKNRIGLKEGLLGQAVHEKQEISLDKPTEHDLEISSATWEAAPKSLVILPFVFEEKVLGVLELGKLSGFSKSEKQFLDSAIENIALAVHSAVARKQIQELLNETQVQSEELQTQQEELRQMNEELEEQTQNLKQQQEELQMTNEELEEQTQALEAKNKEIEAAKTDVERKTKQLEVTSKYKSEFLANMSHELRTPLNSLLILSKDLAENKKKNLDEDQIESSEIIYKSGHDLLLLINEVLDLSRVEAGKMTLNIERVRLTEFFDDLFKIFKFQASQKGLELRSKLDSDLPEYIQTDPQRLNQILKNLLSNAIKFTEEGSVKMGVSLKEDQRIEIAVKDTGIGIKEEKQLSIFEAFQQAEGGTARRYGGTGLGLSISRELVKLLGGEIRLESTYGEGSTFRVLLPLSTSVSAPEPREEPKPMVTGGTEKQFVGYPTIEDDRQSIQKGDKVLLIVEDDLQFAKILKRQANQKGFKTITAATGEDGIAHAREFNPLAVILDIDLPGINGHQVLNELKADPALRHIPVHMVSVDERTLDPIKQGAVEYLMKPIDKKDLDRAFGRIEDFVHRKMKNLLIVEDDANSRVAIKKLIGNGDVKCLEAASGEEALETMNDKPIDCVVLDIGLPDMSGFDLIQKLEKDQRQVPPIIIYTGKELTKEENEELEKYADSIIIKGVKSEERLLDETALFLHRTISNLPDHKQQIITSLYDKETILGGKKILVVDDDMRNVFALSKVLKERGMEVLKADNGVNALKALEAHPEIDLVLMDIMMPEMDGYEAMTKIRKEKRLRDLPIIALTAKAMRDDKQKCIDAGANDYISKPVDIPRLVSLMQVWLSR